MQYIQNNFTVENIVAKYRNYVKEHCPKSSEFDGYEQFDAPIGYYGNTDEQLLVTLYKRVAGKKADKKVLKVLAKYADAYCPEALSEAELSFLCSNIGSCVNYLFSNLKKTNSIFLNRLPEEQVESIIKENTIKKEGATIFIGNNNNGDMACLFPQCKITCFISVNDKSYNEEVWALVMIRLFANGIHSEIRMSSGECLDKSYLGDVDCVVWGVDLYSKNVHLDNVYSQLKPGAQMILFFADNEVAGKEKMYSLRKSFVEDMAIKSIISFEWGIKKSKTIVLLIEKRIHNIVHIENRISNEKFDIESSELDCDILWPSYYSTKKPQAGMPLSKIVSIIKPKEIKLIKKEKDLRFSELLDDEAELKIISHLNYRFQVNWTLPEEIKTMPVVSVDKMATEYKDANVLSKELKLAGDPIYDEDWRFRMTQIKEESVLLYGNEEKTVVGYIKELPDTGVVTMMPIVRFKPKKGYDVRYIAALLLSDGVKNQIRNICENSINNYTIPLIFDKVIVPAHSLKERLAFLSEANYTALDSLRVSMQKEYEDKLVTIKTDYTNEVRMRKHDMRPQLQELKSSINLMQFYVDNMGTTENLQEHLARQISRFNKAYGHLSAIVDHLSDEEEYGIPEKYAIIDNIKDIALEYKNKGYKVNCTIDEVGLEAFLAKKIKVLIDADNKVNDDGAGIDKKKLLDWANIYIAPLDFHRMVQNILENAIVHGFTDKSRKDYELWIKVSADVTRGMISVDFMNNGTVLPDGMTKERYGIRGEKAGKTSGSGSGGYIVKSIVTHYGGDYDIFCNEGITTIRLLLPIFAL